MCVKSSFPGKYAGNLSLQAGSQRRSALNSAAARDEAARVVGSACHSRVCQ